jgi:hypothetical protein
LAGGQAGRGSGAAGGTSILNENTVGSRFATVRFTTIHFYAPCPVGPGTPDLWCITVATQASFLYFGASRFFPVCMCFLFFYFSAVLFKLIVIFPSMTSNKKTEKKKKSKQLTLRLC